MNGKPHILVVDDHRDIRELVSRYLVKNGFRATASEDARSARSALATSAIDLVVLDVMMPGEDGLSLCRYLRESTQIPVILLTAMAEETDRIVGLEIGADDYLTKPFNPRELLARIRSVLRRTEAMPPNREPRTGGTYRFAGWALDPVRRELIRADGVAVSLSTGEFRLLVAFLDRPGMVLSRDQLLDITRGRDAVPFDRSIDNQVSRLRRKIEDEPKEPKLIKTIWGGGYAFSADVERQ